MKYTYGQKVYKIAVDAGLTCPNRDGTLGERGCIFCSAGGSGDFAVPIAGGGRQDGQSVVGASANGCVYEHRSKRDSRGASTEVYHKEYERRGSCVDVERKTLDIKRQMERGMAKFHKKVGEKFCHLFSGIHEHLWRSGILGTHLAGSIRRGVGRWNQYCDKTGLSGDSGSIGSCKKSGDGCSGEPVRKCRDSYFDTRKIAKGVCREWQIHLD